ncbi:uncharacterized protein OCT59_003557 [Rhizophagus irregularis]|uniref:Uncharacterized protein n=2 Tax=Rhizophagus irregularis TaxID=588596 RepID=A0A2I1EU80_9GLOM|nr:hypothetical protein RirG_237890 [Rhizophagus irregularis DAOM 197198w]PKY25655.1 hypothetical protein RhiirB3_440685 [Rhizophagus irregularis]GBC37545.1 hypothetical protein GLOIN_2v1761530 [Rhizophagus irregularis DAOM 181602=DAOM 197198]UZO12006.1 hypothetical protein OCT59_003557 [Rhizophagus irregularis]CAB5213004.1 unnamed protein product [Rhizophagus irregularis]
MNSNNNTTQAYSGSPINQAENDFAPLQILDNGNDNVQHNLINNAGISNMNLNTLNININTISTTIPQNLFFKTPHLNFILIYQMILVSIVLHTSIRKYLTLK